MTGRTNSTPIRVAMPPAVERIRKPSPMPSTATTVRYRVAPSTARTASGRASEIPCEPSRAWPPAKVMSTVTRPTVKVTAASTPALARREGGPDHPGGVLPGDGEHPQHPDGELGQVDPDEILVDGVEVSAGA